MHKLIRSCRPVLFVAAFITVTAACSTQTDDPLAGDAFPIVANADLAVGPQRLLVGLVTPDAESVAAPDLQVEIDLYPPDVDQPAITADGTFAWTVPDIRGIYYTNVAFDVAGNWQLAVHSGPDHTGTKIPFSVAQESLTPAVGTAAPASVTPTLDTARIADITTDPNPDARFYQTSLDIAIASGRPTVLVFSTPAFCETATCGPMLDTVKTIADGFPDVNFVHVEVYENLDAATRDELLLAPAVALWRLPSEPWTFIIDSAGRIAAKFEGTITTDELNATLTNLD